MVHCSQGYILNIRSFLEAYWCHFWNRPSYNSCSNLQGTCYSCHSLHCYHSPYYYCWGWIQPAGRSMVQIQPRHTGDLDTPVLCYPYLHCQIMMTCRIAVAHSQPTSPLLHLLKQCMKKKNHQFLNMFLQDRICIEWRLDSWKQCASESVQVPVYSWGLNVMYFTEYEWI